MYSTRKWGRGHIKTPIPVPSSACQTSNLTLTHRCSQIKTSALMWLARAEFLHVMDFHITCRNSGSCISLCHSLNDSWLPHMHFILCIALDRCFAASPCPTNLMPLAQSRKTFTEEPVPAHHLPDHGLGFGSLLRGLHSPTIDIVV